MLQRARRACRDRSAAHRPAAASSRTCSRTISAGGRSIQGTSGRTPRQVLVVAPQQGRQPGEAGFDQHELERGKFLEHAFGEEAHQLDLERRRLRDVVLDAIGRPARRRRRVVIGAAGVDADRQADASRPPRRSANRAAARAASRPSRAAAPARSGDRAPRARSRATASSGFCAGTRIEARRRGSRSSSSCATQSFTAAHKRRRHVLVEQRDRAVQRVADREPRAERIERLAADRVEVAARQARGLPPVRARGERRVRRIAREDEGVSVDVAVGELIAPIVVEIGQQRRRRPASPDAGRSRWRRSAEPSWAVTCVRAAAAAMMQYTTSSGRKVGRTACPNGAMERERPPSASRWAHSHDRPRPGDRHPDGAAGRDPDFQHCVHCRGCRVLQAEGLKVANRTIVGVGSVNAVIAGSADFTMGTGPVFLRAAAQGQRLLAFTNLIDKPLVELVLRKDVAAAAHITDTMPLAERAKAFKGKTIGIQGVGSIVHAWERLVASRGGLDIEKDVRIAPMDPPAMPAALQTKSIDGYATSLPFTTQSVLAGTAIMLASAVRDAPDLLPFAYGLVYTRPIPVRSSGTNAPGWRARSLAPTVHSRQAGRGARPAQEAVRQDGRRGARRRLADRVAGACEGRARDRAGTGEFAEGQPRGEVARTEGRARKFDGFYTDEFLR